MPSRTIVVVVTAGALSSWGCASLRYKPTELTAAGEAVRVVERSQATPHGCKQVGFVDARNLHGDPVYMRNKLRNDSAEFGATHVHIDDFNRLYSSGTAFVCDSPQDESAGMTSAQGLTPTDPATPPGTPAPTPATQPPAPATQPPAPATQPPGNQAEAPVAPVAHGEPSPAKPGTGGVAPVVAPPSSPPAAAKSESASAATQPAPAPQPAPKAAAAASAQPPAASSDVDPEDVPAPPPVP
ncbi:MAG: hypothetical protein OXR73_34790 [Myxococcales bacterium]|nr:hypothetical protein [Myxococcales bacterium]